MTYLTLRLLHIASMAVWFGAMLFLSGDVRRTLAAGPEHADLLRTRCKRATVAAAAAGGITLLTGFGLIGVLGGMGAVPPAVHMGMTVSIVMLFLGGGVGRTWRSIDAGLAEGKPGADLMPLSKRITILTGIFHLLWVLTLITMVFRSVLMGQG